MAHWNVDSKKSSFNWKFLWKHWWYDMMSCISWLFYFLLKFYFSLRYSLQITFQSHWIHKSSAHWVQKVDTAQWFFRFTHTCQMSYGTIAATAKRRSTKKKVTPLSMTVIKTYNLRMINVRLVCMYIDVIWSIIGEFDSIIGYTYYMYFQSDEWIELVTLYKFSLKNVQFFFAINKIICK